MTLKQALRIVYDLARENRLEDTEGDEGLERMQQEQDEAYDKVWAFLLDMED